MPIDVARIVQAAIEAATQGPNADAHTTPTKPRLSGGRALILGAGLVTVGRLAAPKGREMLGALQQRPAQSESDPEDEEQETEGAYDQPEDEGEDFDEEPEDEGEDFDEEPEDEGEDFDEDDDYDEESDEDFDEEEDEHDGERPRSR